MNGQLTLSVEPGPQLGAEAPGRGGNVALLTMGGRHHFH